ncbi:hypothetical protein Rleg10DRAFT_0053 [Rhizobium leguminosarum bv. trifolii WSM2012]|nr:hypothetical protein Rleg10DRAFT_0053 [Rhizobium leguminosarum bv. trifolii WSM2012]
MKLKVVATRKEPGDVLVVWKPRRSIDNLAH